MLAHRFGEAIRAGRISKVEQINECCVLAAVGHQMASRKGVAATMFSALAKANINIRSAPPHAEPLNSCSSSIRAQALDSQAAPTPAEVLRKARRCSARSLEAFSTSAASVAACSHPCSEPLQA